MDILSQTGMASCVANSTTQTPLMILVQRIVEHRSVSALNELHRRRLFRYRAARLAMASLLAELRDSAFTMQLSENMCEVRDLAYDIALDKFHAMPSRHRSNLRSGDRDEPAFARTNCVYYYKAFLESANRRISRAIPGDDLHHESMAASCLQGFVIRTYWLSCREALRRVRRTVRRYVWRRNGQSLTLLVPSDVPGRRIRAFLSKNLPQTSAVAIDAGAEAQALIDSAFRRRTVMALEAIGEIAGGSSAPSDGMLDDIWTVDDLAATVADEKSDGIDSLRPSIRRLGRRRVREMILAIFASLADGSFSAVDLAGEYGLSKASMSRWAGHRWSQDGRSNGEPGGIPDLWRNVAGVLASDARFMRAARGLLARRKPFAQALAAWEEGRRQR